MFLKPSGPFPLASAPAYGQAGDQIQHCKPRSVVLSNRSCHTLRARRIQMLDDKAPHLFRRDEAIYMVNERLLILCPIPQTT